MLRTVVEELTVETRRAIKASAFYVPIAIFFITAFLAIAPHVISFRHTNLDGVIQEVYAKRWFILNICTITTILVFLYVLRRVFYLLNTKVGIDENNKKFVFEKSGKVSVISFEKTIEFRVTNINPSIIPIRRVREKYFVVFLCYGNETIPHAKIFRIIKKENLEIFYKSSPIPVRKVSH